MNTLIKNYMTEKTEDQSKLFYKGFTLRGYNSIKTPENFKINYNWSDFPYRVVWVNEKELSVLTFTEGDITLNVFKSEAAYNEYIQEAEEFYKLY